MLTKLEHLEDIANENKLHIHNYHFSNTKKAACMQFGDYKAIALDRPAIETNVEEGILLAEEIGHYETGGLYSINATYNTPVARSNRIKFEAKAKHWAIVALLSPEEIESGMRISCGDIMMVAEHCQVTVDFLEEAIHYYRSHGFEFWFDRINDDYESSVATISHDTRDDDGCASDTLDDLTSSSFAPRDDVVIKDGTQLKHRALTFEDFNFNVQDKKTVSPQYLEEIILEIFELDDFIFKYNKTSF